MCTGKRSPEVYAVAHVDRYALQHRVLKANALTLVVCKKYALTLRVWKAYSLALGVWKAHAVACVVRTTHALTLVVRNKYTLTLCFWKAKCRDAHGPEGIYPGTRRPVSTCRGVRRLEEIRPYTRCLEGKMPRHSSSGRYMPWHSSSGKHLPWRVSTERHIA